MKGLTGNSVVQRAKFLMQRELDKAKESNATVEVIDHTS